MQQLARDAEALVQRGWTRDGDGMGVVKTFHFKSYFKAIVSFCFDRRLQVSVRANPVRPL